MQGGSPAFFSKMVFVKLYCFLLNFMSYEKNLNRDR